MFFKGSVLKRIAIENKRNMGISHKDSKDILYRSTLAFSEGSSTYDIFLSHSFQDADIILGLKIEFERLGHSAYVDWVEDPNLDRSRVTPKTASLLRNRMQSCRSLFFAVSDNSPNSKWMPWELGYFDAFKNKVAILPITETDPDQYSGQEYLGLYPYVTIQLSTKKEEILWIRWNLSTYVDYRSWLSGKEPINHG